MYLFVLYTNEGKRMGYFLADKLVSGEMIANTNLASIGEGTYKVYECVELKYECVELKNNRNEKEEEE